MNQKDEVMLAKVNAMALLAVARMLKHKSETIEDIEDMEQIIPIASGLEKECQNIIIEHLETEQIAGLAGALLAARVMSKVDRMLKMLVQVTGSVDKEQFLKSIARACSKVLEQEVEI